MLDFAARFARRETVEMLRGSRRGNRCDVKLTQVSAGHRLAISGLGYSPEARDFCAGLAGRAAQPVPQAIPSADDVVDNSAMLVTRRRLGAAQKRFADHDWAGRDGALAVTGVNVGEDDSGRSGELALRIGLGCLLHEVRPDRQRGLGAAETVSVAVVESDPHERQ